MTAVQKPVLFEPITSDHLTGEGFLSVLTRLSACRFNRYDVGMWERLLALVELLSTIRSNVGNGLEAGVSPSLLSAKGGSSVAPPQRQPQTVVMAIANSLAVCRT